MASNEPHHDGLTGAFYGPNIPPEVPPPNLHRPKHRRHEFKPYTLLCTAFKIFTLVLITIGIIVLCLWLIYQPQTLKIHVQSANLTLFNLSPSNLTLYYNLSVNLTVRNPNQKYNLYFKRIEADALYSGSRFDFLLLPLYKQGRKNTTTLVFRFQGQNVVNGDTVRSTFDREKGEGWFYIDLKMYLKVRLKMLIVQSVEYRPDVSCSLRLPAPGNSTSAAAGFAVTECNVESFS
ncbi:Late embryogenesis abundant protein LEA-2 subgroup domain-containing protein [Dioscorea alata]|uniref:Late embryogenesis abundant protein LEA-2 subgroup domain-containing protein n=1 Tax=Dioscorea alata TaxID=55571 RepID=A0ACB7WBQ4_DIOAL|nr:Late embryogenesis abundant protein LEA-2 subgroup domain-containing protein [Dioscorea alata]